MNTATPAPRAADALLVHREVLERLLCPRCRQGRLDLTGPGPEDALRCEACGGAFPQRGGVPVLLAWHQSTARLLDEFTRYREFYRKLDEGLIAEERLNVKEDAIRAAIAVYRRYFEEAARRIAFSKRPRLLDTGAGMTETTLRLAQRGAQAVATDFSPYEMANPRLYSLTEEEIDFATFSVYGGQRPLRPEERIYPRIVADSENLPFQDGAFDVVFTRSSLHHVKDLPAVLSEMARVCRPGGQLVVAGECIRSVCDTEQEYLADVLDFQEGVDEQMRTWPEYHVALREAGWSRIVVQPFQPSPGRRLPRRLARLGLNAKLDWMDGKDVGSALGLWALRWMGCGFNVYAERSNRAPKVQVQVNLTPPADPAALMADWTQNLSAIARLGRTAYDPVTLSRLVRLDESLAVPPHRGWALPVGTARGVGRALPRRAHLVFAGTGVERLRLLFAQEMTEDDIAQFAVFANGALLELEYVDAKGELTYLLPASEERVLEARLEWEGRWPGPVLLEAEVV